MKNTLIYFITLLLSVSALCGCSKENTLTLETGKDAPARTGAEKYSASLISAYIEKAMKDAETVIDGTIISWLGETEEGTLYYVKTNQVLCGDKYDDFILYHTGNSRISNDGCVLPQRGNRFIMFLANNMRFCPDGKIIPELAEQYEVAESAMPGKPILYRTGSASLDVAEYDGKLYALDRYASVLQTGVLTPVDIDIAAKVVGVIRKTDPIIDSRAFTWYKDMESNIYYVYDSADVQKLAQSLFDKNK